MVLALAVLLVLVGLIGIVVPGLPGAVLIFCGLLLAAWSDGFTRVGVPMIVILGLATAASYVVDIAIMTLGMNRAGATRRAMAGAAIGALAGALFGLPGLLVGPFVGAVAGELTARRELALAGRAGAVAWVSFLVGTAAKVGLAFAMVALFLAAWFIE